MMRYEVTPEQAILAFDILRSIAYSEDDKGRMLPNGMAIVQGDSMKQVKQLVDEVTEEG